MACHEIAALRLGMMRVLRIDDEVERQHELAELNQRRVRHRAGAIHSTADFEFARTIRFAAGAIRSGIEAIRAGRSVVADVQMVQAGINKAGIKKFGGEVLCFIGDDDVAEQARAAGLTRAIMSMSPKGWPGHALGAFRVSERQEALARFSQRWRLL